MKAEKSDAANFDTPPVPRKEWRDPEGSIIRKKEKRRDSRGRWKEVELIYARVRYTDGDGKKREKKRLANSVNDAIIKRRQLREEILDDLQKETDAVAEDEKEKTFSELVEYYKSTKVKKAVFRGDQLVEGFRTPIVIIERELKILEGFFGDVLLSRIKYDDLAAFRRKRLSTPVYQQVRRNEAELENRPVKQRKVSSVNRELSRLRSILNLAIRRGWLDINPFHRGEVLISLAAETERTRILTRNEEHLILQKCVYTGEKQSRKGNTQNEKRTHLKPVIIAALDTAMRYGEIMKLVWQDVDFTGGVIRAEGKNTKTLKKRIVPITARLRVELEKLYEESDKNPSTRVFHFADTKKAFKTAARLAGCPDVRFHDLRHTAITWMVQAQIPAADVMKISGHTQMKTFQRYLNHNSEIAQSIAARMDAFRLEAAAAATPQALPLSEEVEK